MKGRTELLEQTGDGIDLVAQLKQLKEKLCELQVGLESQRVKLIHLSSSVLGVR